MFIDCITYLDTSSIMFTKYLIDYKDDMFTLLSASVEFEYVCKGRKGAILVDAQDDLVPIVRTTTVYIKPAQTFLPIHLELVNNIRSVSNIADLQLNNAIIEIYDNSYRTMKFHSDQALDLTDDSYICVFSCYDNPISDMRKLQIKHKTTGELSEIVMEHNSVIIFSIDTNKKYLHRIVPISTVKSSDQSCRWLGVTLRLSKTLIRFVNEIPYFSTTSKILRLNTDKREFMKQKGVENSNSGYDCVDIDYTISISDTMLPVTRI